MVHPAVGMATSGDLAQDGRTIHHVELTLEPTSRFQVPDSDGYTLYSALLNAIQTVDPEASEQVHDADLSSLHVSSLQGVFADGNRPHHKTLLPTEQYTARIGVTDPSDTDIFQSLLHTLVIDNNAIELTNGTLEIRTFESTSTTHADILDTAAEHHNHALAFEFQTATCIEEAGDITTMFPHRVPVFQSLLGKWNRTAPNTLELDLARETIEAALIEKPNASSYQTHSVLVNRVTDNDGNSRPILRQGFTGHCEYAFKDASESVTNALTTLALFAEYAGVGSAVARGCGNVTVEAINK